jgi:hypothetical protein
MSAMTTFLIGTATASAVWLLLTRRMQNSRDRRPSPDGGTSGSCGTSSDGDGWSLASWGGWDSGGSDSGDGGGGGDGGGD